MKKRLLSLALSTVMIVALVAFAMPAFDASPVYAANSYVLKGIENGERIPVSEDSNSFTRTLTILDATARPRFLTPATDFEKAEFFIDGEKVATVTDNPCQWILTLTDLNEHTLTATVTDINGGMQNFGPYKYRAVLTIDHSSSFTEYFEGDEGDPFPTKLRIPKIDSKNNPVYSAVKGGDGTALKLTMTSMNNTTIETAQDIFVPEQGFVTYDLDVYCTSDSEYLKIYLRSRNAGGFPMKDGDWDILPNLTMEQLGEKNKWHHISFVFDTSRRRFCGFVDGLEVDRGDMGDTPGRNIYLIIATQSYTTGDLYFDNLEIMSKTETNGTWSVINHKYTYKFLDEDGTVLKKETADYGTVITPPENPSKESTARYTYTFAGWNGYTEGMTLNGDKTFTAVYSQAVNKYTYKFLDEDGTVLKETTVNYGAVITPPKHPIKENTAQYTYIFEGWEDFTEGMALDGNKTFTAVYSATVNQYTYKFLNEDGTVLQEKTVNYGTVITPPENPAKESTARYTYTFAGWNGYTEGMTLKGDKTFTAVYSQAVNKYTYKFLDEDGTVLKEETADYGTAITPPEISDKAVYYLFDFWQDYTAGMTLTGDIIFTAVYKYKDYSITAEGLPHTITVAYNSDYMIDPQAPEEGYAFIGYFTEQGGKGTKITDENGESINVYDIADDLNVYPYFKSVYLNKIELYGDASVMPGGKVTQRAVFATDKDAAYFTVKMKYPKYLNFKGIKAVDFAEAAIDSEKEEGGYKYLDIVCVYDYEGNKAPLNTNLIPFETEFDVPTGSPIGNTEICIENAVLIGSGDYEPEVFKNHTFEILPKLAESIEITGQPEIDGAAQYTAVVLPDYTSDKTVIWSVDDEDTATVTQDGTLTPVKNGTVILTAAANDGSGVFATKSVNVTAYAKITGLVFDGIDKQVEFDADIREYTVYPAKGAAAVTLTPTFSEGVLRANGSGLWISGHSKEFSLNETGMTVITLNIENVTDMTNGVYTVKVMEYSEIDTVVSEGGKVFIINPWTQTGDTVILALYNGDDFVGIQHAVYDGNEILFRTDKTYTRAKVMVWSGFGSLQPVCKAKIIK